MSTAPTGETRWTAILSTDMVDFTQITQTIGNEKVYDLLQHVLGIARDVVAAHGGHVIDTAGDGILAAFGAPKALENASVQGCAAAHAFRARLKAEAGDLQARFGIIPRFRSGIAGGNVMVAHQGDAAIKVVGDPVNQAARLQALAGPDEVLLTDSIRREAEGFVATSDRGTQRIKGFDTPVHIHALAEMLEAVTRFEGTRRRGIVGFVSRQAELEQAQQVLQGDLAQLLMIIGVPGVGKSRLTHEIITQMPDGTPIYLGQCAPTGQTPFGPVYDILRQASGTGGAPNVVLQSLADQHPGLCPSEALAAVLEPAGENDDAMNRAYMERQLLLTCLRGLHQMQGAVFVIEDAHWIDNGTEGLIRELTKAPLPLLITTRPTYVPDWQGHSNVQAIALAPLNEAAIREIVQARIAEPVAPALSELIAAKSEGIPLVAEEITRALQHGDQLITTDAGITLASDKADLVTGNLEHMVLSRVDRLPAEQKTLLQVAAAIGRDFSETLLQRASGSETALSDLDGLIEPLGGDGWRFSHALIRDAVYGSLLSGQREAVHGQIAYALEQHSNDPSDALLADHYNKANKPNKTVYYLIRAAQASHKAYALNDVDDTLDQALKFLESDPSMTDGQTFAAMSITWLRALDQRGRFARLKAIADRVMPRIEADRQRHELNLARVMTAIAMTHLRDYATAEKLALLAQKDAEDMGDTHAAAWAKVALVRLYEETYWRMPDDILKLADEVAPVAAATGDTHMAMMALYQKTAVYRSSGGRLKALDIGQEIAAFSETHNDRRGKSYALWAQALVYTVEGDPEAAHALIEAGREDVLPGTADDTVTRGVDAFCQIFLEPPEVAEQKISALRDEVEEFRDYNITHSCEWMLAIVAFKSGRLAKGWRILSKLTPEATAFGHVNFLRQILNTRAEVLLSIVGLIDPAAEAPPERPRFPRAKPTLADIATFASLRLRARRLAEQDLHHCISLDPLQQGVHFARAKINLGLIAKAQGQKDAAIAALREGHAQAMTEEIHVLRKRAEQALDALGASVNSGFS